MCYHTNTPSKAELSDYSKSQFITDYGWKATVSFSEEYPGYSHADGFKFPQLPVICNDSPDKIILSEWGYLPGKVNGEKEIKEFRYKFLTLNAKADTFTSSRLFKTAFEKRRCVILIKGFYDNRHETQKLKIPYYIHPRNSDMWLLSGIYNDTVDTSTGRVFRNVAIATTPTNEMMSYIHNSKLRMPFIIDKERLPFWLKSEELADSEVLSMVKPYSENEMAAHTISRDFNSRKTITNIPEITTAVTYDGLKNFN